MRYLRLCLQCSPMELAPVDETSCNQRGKCQTLKPGGAIFFLRAVLMNALADKCAYLVSYLMLFSIMWFMFPWIGSWFCVIVTILQ